MKKSSSLFLKTSVKNYFFHSTLLDDIEIITNLSNENPTFINSELINNKIAQEEIYYRQRRVNLKSVETHQNHNFDNDMQKSFTYKIFFEQEIQKKIEYKKNLSYKDVEFLKIFLTKYGKIRSRQITKLSYSNQSLVSELIKKARANKLIPLKFAIFS